MIKDAVVSATAFFVCRMRICRSGIHIGRVLSIAYWSDINILPPKWLTAITIEYSNAIHTKRVCL